MTDSMTVIEPASNEPRPEAVASLHGSEHKTYYPALDGLRALAVLMVFGQHYFEMPFGWAGVDIFFVLSGFLITGILWKTRKDEHRYRNFYLRRSLRIFPVYYAAFLVLFLITPFMHLQWHPEQLFWLVYLGNWSAYIHMARFGDYYWGIIPGLVSIHGQVRPIYISIRHFWSLCVEEQFYLFWPFLMYFLKRRRIILAMSIAVVLGIPVLRRICLDLLPHVLVHRRVFYYLTVFRIDALMMGALITMLLASRASRIVRKSAIWIFPAAVAVLIVTYAIAVRLYGTAHILYLERWMNVFGFSLLDLAAAGLVIMALDARSRVYRFFCWKPLRWLGLRSYGFYVYHELLRPFLEPLLSLHHGYLIRGGVGLLLALGLSWLSFRFLETPFLRLKDRYA